MSLRHAPVDDLTSVCSAVDADILTGRIDRAGLVRQLVRVLVGTGAAVLFLAAAFLWYRRLAGALSRPLSAAGLVGVGLGLAAAVLAARQAWRSTGAAGTANGLFSALLTLSVLAFATATAVPGSAPWGLAGLGLVLLGEELWSWWPRPHIRPEPVRVVPGAIAKQAGGPHCRSEFQRAIAGSTFGLEVAHEHVTQQVTRVMEPDGTEKVVGWMRVSFEPGQRLASVHLAFCPPFTRTPEATLQRLEGPEARIKRVQVLPFGARFDLKLDSPAQQRSDLLLRVAAESQAEPAGGEARSDRDAVSPPGAE
ncbi:MAG: hypothetical protein ACYC6Y_28500 [Thermoguttaceae bacterium]